MRARALIVLLAVIAACVICACGGPVARTINGHPCTGASYQMACLGHQGPSKLSFTLTPGFGVDMWGAEIPAAAAKADGATFAGSYLSGVPGKDWTAATVRSYEAAGLGVIAVWETTAARALDGEQAGVADATAALREATAAGLPAGRPIFFAVDTDTTAPAVAAYFTGVASILGARRTGVYGSDQVVNGLWADGLVGYVWQTVAWSHGEWSSHACVRQTSIDDTFDGHSVDFDESECADYGQWQYVAPKPKPAPKPARVICWGPHAQMANQTCKTVRPELSKLSNARDASKAALAATDRNLASNRCRRPYRRGVCVKDGRAARVFAQRARYFAAKASALFAAYS